MKYSKALLNSLVGSPDFPGQTGKERGCTVNRVGPAKLVGVFKCPNCGYSFTN